MRESSVLSSAESHQALKQLGLALALLGLFAGILLSYSVLAGDAQGRVNLLFLLLLFAFVPVAGLLLSLFLLAKGGGKGLSGWILEIPLWPRHLTLELLKLGAQHNRKPWLFYQTQLLSLSFSVGSLLTYMLLLLGSDISFIWRSTLLEAGDLLPVLNFISYPWKFWPEAQASLELIEQTRDFRLDSQIAAESIVGQWWKYILATQLTYNLLPRSIMLFAARQLYISRMGNDKNASVLESQAQQQTELSNEFLLANLVDSVAGPYIILDWAGAPGFCYEKVQALLGEATAISQIGPLSNSSEDPIHRNLSTVVLVKSWEPPLAELADLLCAVETDTEKLILPLDWDDSSVQPVTPIHLDEWRRFAATLTSWNVLQLKELK